MVGEGGKGSERVREEDFGCGPAVRRFGVVVGLIARVGIVRELDVVGAAAAVDVVGAVDGDVAEKFGRIENEFGVAKC